MTPLRCDTAWVATSRLRGTPLEPTIHVADLRSPYPNGYGTKIGHQMDPLNWLFLVLNPPCLGGLLELLAYAH